MRSMWFEQLLNILPELENIDNEGRVEYPVPVMFVDEAVVEGKLEWADPKGRPDMGTGSDTDLYVKLTRPATPEERQAGSTRIVSQVLRIDNDQLEVSYA